jgi:hypothetical protein
MGRLRMRLHLTAALLVAAGTANAGVLATSAGTYQGTWHGSAPFTTPAGLSGYVDYAVYAPGDFPIGFAGYTPSQGEYVYAYQAFETAPGSLSTVSVNLVFGAADNIGAFSGSGVSHDPSISSVLVPFDSATWSFNGVIAGGSTTGLVFSGPFFPMMDGGSLINGESGGQSFLIPTPGSPEVNPPLPEPSSLGLAAIGIGALLGLRWRRRTRLAA